MKRIIAREWLIFLEVEGLGLLRYPVWLAVFYFRYRSNIAADAYGHDWFTVFWNDIVYPESGVLVRWFVYPYLGAAAVNLVVD